MRPVVEELEAIDLYRQMFRDNEAIKLLIDPATGEIVDANEAAARFYGYSIDKLRTMHIGAINALPDDELRRALSEAHGEDRRHFRFQHRVATGEVRRVEVYTGPISHRGRLLLFSIIHDVTDRERAEHELARSEAQFRTLVETLPIGVAVHREGRVLYHNRAGAEMMGGEAADFVGAAVFDHVDPASQRETARRIAEVAERRVIAPLRRTHLIRRDGTRFTADVSSVPIELEGKAAVMSLVVDTSERDRLEDQLRASQRLDAVGRLARGVAHDFNNFMSVILGAGKLLARKLPADSALQAHLENIESAATRAAALTRELLLFARGAEPSPEAVDLDATLAGIASLLRGSLGSSVELVIRRASAPCLVRVARLHLEQVLVNLAVNARDAMPDGGMLTFTLARTMDAAGRPFAELVVRDTGSGMSAEVAAHVFEPFFTTKPDGQGTGLGLAISYGIVQAAGGTISVDSALGAGTAFTIRLPIADA